MCIILFTFSAVNENSLQKHKVHSDYLEGLKLTAWHEQECCVRQLKQVASVVLTAQKDIKRSV